MTKANEHMKKRVRRKGAEHPRASRDLTASQPVLGRAPMMRGSSARVRAYWPVRIGYTELVAHP